VSSHHVREEADPAGAVINARGGGSGAASAADAVPHVTIGVITFRRPEGLRRLLRSLAELRFRERMPRIEILIVDNDAEGSAAAVVRKFGAGALHPIRYVPEPHRGISFARNRVFDSLRDDTDFVAFIDDDEFADPAWLEELLDAQRRHEADIVAGPVLAVLPDDVAPWKRSFFRRRRMPTGTRITESGSGNVLIAKDLLDRTQIRFREGSSHVGGEDTRLFMRLTAMGARMIWCDSAIAHEKVPPTRTRFSWMVRRSFRGGTTWSACEREVKPSIWVLANRTARSLFRIAQGLMMVTLGAPFGRGVMFRGVRHIATGAGNLAGLLGVAPEEYKVIHGS
jgi:succinoglycan biosynthesis protein ExoM